MGYIVKILNSENILFLAMMIVKQQKIMKRPLLSGNLKIMIRHRKYSQQFKN